MVRLLSLALVPALVACRPAEGVPPVGPLPMEGFWAHWGDGRAEVNGYALTQPRYGEDRRGEAVLIFVTEDFDASRAVKSDGGGPGTYPALKLNEARDFQTGIYDYNAMTSVFVPLDGRLPAGVPAKVSFSMQEWCGHVWDQVVVGPDGGQRVLHSYFEDEGEQQAALDLPDGAAFADALPIVVRGLVGGPIAPGPMTLAPRLLDLRLHHAPLRWQDASIRVEEEGEQVVPAGTFATRTVEVRVGADWTRFHVERAAPHRLVGWERSDGERAALTGSVRQAYWEQSREGSEALRAELGLPQRPWPAPQSAR